MNLKTNQKGFTIVELLIVIVVIAILAAISIVAYSGIQNRAKTSSGQQLASQVAKKVQAYNTVQSVWPTHAQLTAATSAVPESQLDAPTAVIEYSATAASAGDPATATNYDSGKKVIYRACTNGGLIYYWDYAATPSATSKSVTVGAGCP